METQKYSLGNYVYDNEDRGDKTLYKVVRTETEEFTDYNTGDDYCVTVIHKGTFYDIVPTSLPLTDKILLNFGAKKIKEGEYRVVDCIILRLEDNDWENVSFDLFWRETYVTAISYAHQLQNFYQSTHFKELEYNGK